MSESKTLATDDKRCTSISRTQGRRCGNWAVKGTKVCRMHGGKAPQVKAKASERAIERKIMTELDRKKLTGKALVGTTKPLDELQKLTTELVYFKDQLTQRVNDLGDKLAHYNNENSESVKVEIDVYLKVIDKLTKTLDIALKHDIEGKKLSLETAKAELVAAALYRVLSGIGATREQIEHAKNLLHKELTAIAQE